MNSTRYSETDNHLAPTTQGYISPSVYTKLQILDKIIGAIPRAFAAPFIELRRIEMMQKRMDAHVQLCIRVHTSIHQTLSELAMAGKLTPELRLYYYQLLQLYKF